MDQHQPCQDVWSVCGVICAWGGGGGGGYVLKCRRQSVSVLPTCDFMLVGKDKLSKSAADEKWDRIKVVCTQPYNKVTRLSPQCGWGHSSWHVCYGKMIYIRR